jgi:uncharacterized membrane protein
MSGSAITAILLALIVIIYMIPTIVAFGRDHPHRNAVAVINILFGWTLIVWFFVFLWAALATPRPAEI